MQTWLSCVDSNTQNVIVFYHENNIVVMFSLQIQDDFLGRAYIPFNLTDVNSRDSFLVVCCSMHATVCHVQINFYIKISSQFLQIYCCREARYNYCVYTL